eukprot:414844-Prorocentrum_minimum.AAC.1
MAAAAAAAVVQMLGEVCDGTGPGPPGEGFDWFDRPGTGPVTGEDWSAPVTARSTLRKTETARTPP